jgi:pyridoxal phosphate enzyme (YggS family)
MRITASCVYPAYTSAPYLRYRESVSIADNIAGIRRRLDAACRRAGRHPGSVALMAVTKTVEAGRIREAYAAGIRLFGENRVQEFAAKAPGVRDLRDIEAHMIGHLQSNKVTQAMELFHAIDSVDSLRLAKKLDSAAAALGKKIPVLIEVNIGREQTKSGVNPGSDELRELLEGAPELLWLQIHGLMTVPPYEDDSEKSRPYFRRMRELFDDIAGRNQAAVHMDCLSMGMSHDFEVAVEEGATRVRIGTAVFGPRPI